MNNLSERITIEFDVPIFDVWYIILVYIILYIILVYPETRCRCFLFAQLRRLFWRTNVTSHCVYIVHCFFRIICKNKIRRCRPNDEMLSNIVNIKCTSSVLLRRVCILLLYDFDRSSCVSIECDGKFYCWARVFAFRSLGVRVELRCRILWRMDSRDNYQHRNALFHY